MKNLKGKKAIITGGSRGLGRATAIALAKEDVEIAITGRNEETLQQTVAELEAIGVKAMYSVFDISKYEEVKNSIKEILNTLGDVDILINNAGIATLGSFNDMEVDVWTQMIETNVLGTYFVTKEVLPFFIEKE
eukprot:TRINITY_DN566_c0_g1_i1.p2 TRINITY_DN566_c0_g1~~TRINITY_DN566_c0_g1_i1.p2  ORF type:complete len:134 (-),score=43.62 TRINITY_DN566_c0_g1_i1:1502-1903(-)